MVPLLQCASYWEGSKKSYVQKIHLGLAPQLGLPTWDLKEIPVGNLCAWPSTRFKGSFSEPWLYWSQWHNRPGLGFHSTAFRFHTFSAVASPNYFFPAHLEHKVGHWIIATQSNLPTADFSQSVNSTTEFCTYWGASFQIYTQENKSHYIFSNYRQYNDLSLHLYLM